MNCSLSLSLHSSRQFDGAVVNDQEYRATLPQISCMIDLAAKMISESRGSELMPQKANPDSPITLYRAMGGA